MTVTQYIVRTTRRVMWGCTLASVVSGMFIGVLFRNGIVGYLSGAAIFWALWFGSGYAVCWPARRQIAEWEDIR